MNETREIISILLKELETLQSTLQKKENLLETNQTGKYKVQGSELIDVNHRQQKRIHKEELTYECETCEKTFKENSNSH